MRWIKALAAALAVCLLFWPLTGCSVINGLIPGSGQSGTDGGTEDASGEGAGDADVTPRDYVDPEAKKGDRSGAADREDPEEAAEAEPEEEGMRPIEEGGHIFPDLGASPGDIACGGMSVQAEDGTLYVANISGSGTITRISPDGTEKVICDIEPWDEMRKVTDLNLWNNCLYFEIGPVFYYTLYFATYHYPINGIYKLDLAWTEDYLRRMEAGEEGYEDLPEPVSVIQDVGAMGASYAEIGYYDPLVIGGQLYYWVNNDYAKGRQLCRSSLNGADPVQIYDSKDHKVLSWTSDGKDIYIADDESIFRLSPDGSQTKVVRGSGHHLQCYGQDIYFAQEGRVLRFRPGVAGVPDVVLQRDGTIKEFNVHDGKIYFVEETPAPVSTYVGVASGFEPEDVAYLYRYITDADLAGYGRTLIKGPSVGGDLLYYTESFVDDKESEYGDVGYVALDPATGEIEEVRTGPGE